VIAPTTVVADGSIPAQLYGERKSFVHWYEPDALIWVASSNRLVKARCRSERTARASSSPKWRAPMKMGNTRLP
jgi:hypothetical protein